MLPFDLPLVAANISVDNALKTAIDAKRSGVVLKTKSGGLHLVHYKNLVSASRNKTAINEVDFIPILNVGRKKTVMLQLDSVQSAGMKFGYRGATGDIANLLSLRETFAKRYLTASGGSRCGRPNKPANLPQLVSLLSARTARPEESGHLQDMRCKNSIGRSRALYLTRSASRLFLEVFCRRQFFADAGVHLH